MQSIAALPAAGNSRAHSPALARTSRLIRRVFLMGSTALAGVPVVGVIGDAAANPQGGVVVGGAISIQQTSATQLDVVQQSQRGIIDWRSFSIGANETTNFIQPLGGVTLNRVVGDQASQIFGRLTATGTIFLVNQNGIIFGQGAQVDVGGLVATTANISNTNFMAGLFKFDQASPLRSASVINHGDITVRDAGLAAFVAPGVENTGVIEAKLGRVLLGGAETFAVDLYGDGLLSFSLGNGVQARPVNASGQPMEALASNSGTIKADGGSVMIAARQAVKVVENVVNMSGRIEATSVEMRGGTVVLSGGDSGRVAVSGQIDASGKDAGEKGGSVQVLGDVVALQAGAGIDVSGDTGGGTALIGGDWQGGGDTQRATSTTVASGASIAADALTDGDGGTVVVWADKDTRFDGAITARGGAAAGNGGKVETSGKRDLLVGNNAKVDATAPKGTNGKWLLDPLNVIIGSVTVAGFLDGGDPNTYVPTATGATVSASAILAALNAGVDVEVTTGTTGAEAGNITVATALSWSSARQLKLSAAGAIDIQAPITASAGALAMEALGGSITQTAAGTLNVDRLSAKSAGAITLNQGNSVNTLQLLSGNDDVVLIDVGGGLVAVGDIYSCFGTATVTTAGNLTAARVLGQVASLTATGGSITLTDDVQSPLGTLTLSAGGNITQTGGVITIKTLTGSASGTTSLNSANLITNLSTFASTGGLTINNAQTLTVTGAVSSGGIINLTASAGNIVNTLTTGTITGSIVALTASAGFVQVVEDITATDTIKLLGATGVTQNSTGILNATALYAESAASVTLQQGNLVGAVAGKITAGTGSFLFTNANSVNVSNVDTSNGIATTGGLIRITASAGTLSVSQPINSTGGLIDLVANNMAIGATLTSTGGSSNQVTLRPVSGIVIDLGGADTSSRLGITNAEANNAVATVLQLGTTSGSNIEVTAPITLISTPNLYLASAGTVVQSSGAALTVSGLRLDVTRNAPSVLSDLNDVDTLAGQQTSNCFSSFCSATFSFTDVDGFAVGTVGGSAGLFYSTFAGVTLTATTGAITVTNQIQGGQNLMLIADAMAINNTVSGTNNTTLRPVTAGVTIDLGGTDAAGVLGLDATELTRFSTPNLTIGTNAAGPIMVSSAVTFSGSVSSTLTLQTLDDITFAANLTRTGGGSLSLSADEITINAGTTVDTVRGLSVSARNLTLLGNLDVGSFTSDLASISLTGAFASQAGTSTFTSVGDISVNADAIAVGGSTSGFNVTFNAFTSFANTGAITASGGFLTVFSPTLAIGAAMTGGTIRLEVIGNGLAVGGAAGGGETDLTPTEIGFLNATNLLQFGGTQTGDIRLLSSIDGDSLSVNAIAFVSSGTFTGANVGVTSFQTIGFAVENFVYSGTASISGSTVEFQQINSGSILVGGNDAAGVLGLSTVELSRIIADNYRFGRSTLNDAGTLVGAVTFSTNFEIFNSDTSFVEINATSLTTNNNLGADLALFINADEISFGAAPVYADFVRIAPNSRSTVQIGGTGTGSELLLTTASLSRIAAPELQIGTSTFDLGFENTAGLTTSIVIADATGIVSPRIGALYLAAGSGGTITQSAPIVVSKLLIVEAGTATLTDAGNQVGTLAAGILDTSTSTRTSVSTLSFTAQSSVTIGDMVYSGTTDNLNLDAKGLNAGCTSCSLSTTLTTDAITISEAINVGSNGTLTIRPGTAGTDIAIGGVDGAGTLGISAGELALITSARNVVFGSADTGDISVTTAFSLPALGCCTLGALQFTGTGDFSTTAALAAGGRNTTVTANNITIGDDAADTFSTSTLTNGFSFARPSTNLNATGTVTTNAPISSSGALNISAGGAATFNEAIATESGSVSIAAGGAVALNDTLAVGSGSATVTTDGLLTVGGAMTATSSIRLSATDFAINANVTAPSLRLDAPDTAISIGGGGTLAAAELARLFGSSLVQIGDENTGNLTLAAGISDASFGAVGNLALASGATLALNGNTLTATGTLALSVENATLDAAVTGGVIEIQHVSGGTLALGGADASGVLGLGASELSQLATADLRFGRNSLGSRAGITPGTVSVSGAVSNTMGSVEINATDFSNTAAITASTNLIVNANTMSIGATLNADATTGTVRLAPRSIAFAVDIGGGSSSGVQGFSQTTLDLINAQTLEIGALNTSTFGQALGVGNINISSAVNIATVNQLILVQPTSVFPSVAVTQAAPIAVNTLAIRGNGSITLMDAGNNVENFAAQSNLFNSQVRFANADGFAVASVVDSLGGSVVGVRSGSTSTGLTDVVRLTAFSGDITLNSTVSAGFGGGEARLIATAGKVVQNAGATVTARTLELDLRDSTSMTEANSVQFLAARVTGAGQNLTFTANSSLNTTTSSGGITGVTVPGNLVLRSNFGSISNTAAFNITGTSRFEAPSGSINLTNLLNVFGGLLSFSGFNVTVFAASGIALDTLSLTGSLTLNANGGITQAGAMVVNGTTSLTATNADIVLTNAGNNFGSTISVGAANNVSLVDSSGTTLGNMTIANNLSIEALTGAINATGALVIGGNTTLQIDTAGNAVTANNAGNNFTGLISVLGGASNVTLRDSTTIDLGTVNASGNLVLNGPAMRSSAVITVGGTTTADPNCGCVSFTNAANSFGGTFTTAVALDFLVQAVNPIDLADASILGDFTLANGGFTFGGTLTIDGRSLRLRSAGTALTILPGAVITVAGGSDIVIEADLLSLGAPIIGPSTANLIIMPVTASQTIGVGSGAAGGLSIDNSELALIEGRYRSITFGRAGQTGAITIAGGTFAEPVIFRSNGAGGSITLTGDLIGTGAGSFTFRGSGTTTHLGADIVTAGTPILIDDAVILDTSVTLDTTGGGSVASGAAVSITGTTNGNSGGENLTVTAGTGGAVTFGGALGATTSLGLLSVTGNTISLPSANTRGITLVGTTSLTGTSYLTSGGDFTTTGAVSASVLTIDVTDPDDDGSVLFNDGFSASSLSLILGSGDAFGASVNLGALSVSGTGGSADFTGSLRGFSTEVAARFVSRPDGADADYVFNTCIMSTACGSLLSDLPIEISGPVDPGRFDPGGIFDGGGFYSGGDGDGDGGPIGPGRPFISLSGIVVPVFEPKADETTVQFSNQGNDELW